MENSFVDYIPVIGDIYRYGRLVYKIGTFIAGNDPTDVLLGKMIDNINRAANAETLEEAEFEISKFSDLVEHYTDGKKYQNAIMCYLFARGLHIMALCKWARHSDSLDIKYDINELFNKALTTCATVPKIEKTMFTSNKAIIDAIRELTIEEEKAIKNSRRNWKHHCRKLDMQMHPWKYRLLWIIPLAVLVIIGIAMLITMYLY